MRDAFGGAFMIKLFLVFLAIYIGFTAVAVNYSKAFKVKNKVVEYLENNEVTDMKHMSAAELDSMEEFFEKEKRIKKGWKRDNISTYENLLLLNKYGLK